MSANLSLILNVLLLFIVIIAIGYVVRSRREQLLPNDYKPALGMVADNRFVDDVIAVRKLTPDTLSQASEEQSDPVLYADESENVSVEPSHAAEPASSASAADDEKTQWNAGAPGKTIMFFLLAKDQQHFAGYELLQTILAAGLRFGEGDLFHRHQHANGQGPVLFSLATATESGVFDLQNIGAFNARGLCLFMQTSGNANIDQERYDILCQTAAQLAEELGAYLLDHNRRPIKKESFGSIAQ